MENNSTPENQVSNNNGSVNLPTQDDVKSIPVNKHSPRRANYNSGRIIMACKINRYCPMLRKFKVNDEIVLNYETLKSFPEQYRPSLSAIPGLPGIFPKERYRYLSTFLKVNGKKANNTFSDIEDKAKYRSIQTFSAIESVFDSSSSGPIDENLASNSPEDNFGRVLWGYVRHNEGTDSEDTIGIKTLAKNDNEPADSNVLYVGNKAANPDLTAGLHWKAEKETELFHGEDFFITFRRNALATDLSNIKSSQFSDSNYSFLDVLYDGGGGSDMPLNSGIVSYSQQIKNTENGQEVVKWIKNEDDMKNYDLNKQAYYVIEVGPYLEESLFIVIPQKSYPRAVLKKRDGKSYFLGNYRHFIGGDLIKQDKWTITFKNHLGKLVILFNGDSENPWILEAPSRAYLKLSGFLESSGERVDEYLLEVPPAKVSVWGGNLTSSFCFSPLSYTKEVSAIFGPPLEDGKSNAYSLPLKGVKEAMVAASNVDVDLDSGTILPEPPSGQTNSIEDRVPLWQLDAHKVVETKFSISESVVTPSPHPNQSPTYYLQTQRYLKATSSLTNVTGEGDENSSSKIELNVDGNSIQEDDTGEFFTFNVDLKMTCGDHSFDGVILSSCKAPIITEFRLLAVPDGTPAWEASEIDASNLVMNYNESYSSPDFQTLQHTANIKFLLNKGMDGGLESKRQQIESLRNRAFYIEIWVGYENCNYSKFEELEGFKMFTGICYGGVLEEKAGERTMSCQIHDYSKILEESYIWNSSFWDGVRDNIVMRDLMSELSFRSDSSGDTFGPNFLMKEISKQTTNVIEINTPDGRVTYSTIYALPNSYDRLRSAFYKFKDGTPYWNAMKDIAKKAGKALFFDTYGMLHYENLPYDKFIRGGEDGSSVEALWKFTKFPWGNGQLIFDVFVRERSVSDVVNIIHVVTSTPNREIVADDTVNWDSLYDPSSPGFLGYKKLFLQQDSSFGTQESLQNVSKHYSKFFKAPVIYKWQSYGLPLRALDVAEIDGQKVIITSVQTEIDPARNVWWQNCEGEWYGSEETLTDPQVS